MKTRTDFVSNSSSCSFVIRDVKGAFAAIKTLGTDNIVPYEIDDLIMRIYAKRSVLRDLITLLDRPTEYDDFTQHLDDVDSYDIRLSMLESIPDSLLQKIDDVYLTCEDYEQEKVLYLSILYMFLKNEKIDVDAIDSERPLMFQDCDDSFLGKLMKRAFKNIEG